MEPVLYKNPYSLQEAYQVQVRAQIYQYFPTDGLSFITPCISWYSGGISTQVSHVFGEEEMIRKIVYRKIYNRENWVDSEKQNSNIVKITWDYAGLLKNNADWFNLIYL